MKFNLISLVWMAWLCGSALGEEDASTPKKETGERLITQATSGAIMKWLQAMSLVNPSTYAWMLTVPNKDLGIHFNISGADSLLTSGLGALFLGTAGAYLLGSLPVKNLQQRADQSSHRYEDLAFKGLSRDYDDYEDYRQEEEDYRYGGRDPVRRQHNGPSGFETVMSGLKSIFDNPIGKLQQNYQRYQENLGSRFAKKQMSLDEVDSSAYRKSSNSWSDSDPSRPSRYVSRPYRYQRFRANSREDEFGSQEDDRLEDDFYLNNVYDQHFQSQKDYKK